MENIVGTHSFNPRYKTSKAYVVGEVPFVQAEIKLTNLNLPLLWVCIIHAYQYLACKVQGFFFYVTGIVSMSQTKNIDPPRITIWFSYR